MNEMLKFIVLVVGVMAVTAGIESIAVQLSPINTYFVGVFAGIIVNTIINYVLMFEANK